MRYALQWLRSLIFNGQMYLAMLVVGLVYLIPAMIDRRQAHAAAHAYCAWVLWSAKVLIGLTVEVRGTPPRTEAMVAAKHQSFLDVIAIFHAVPRGKFIMKSILKWAPVLGWFALRMGCVPVDRGRRGAAVQKMLADVAAGNADPGQLVIYPQGTRVSPGRKAPYKIGTAVLYRELGQPVVPVATNIGVFWPKRGVYRRPGHAVVQFLDPIAPGLDVHSFIARLEAEIETASDALNAEAGFVLPPPATEGAA